MKLLGSVLALVLAGLLGGWLWLDASAEARQASAGVLITGPVDPASATSVVHSGAGRETASPPSEGAPATGTAEQGVAGELPTDRVVAVLQSSAGELPEKARKQIAKDKRARERAKQDEEAKKPAVQVQPAPVNPGGWCEWDDGVWECDDWDDDDDWDD